MDAERKEEKIELNSSVYAQFLFFLVWALQWMQGRFGDLFWLIFAKPFFILIKTMDGRPFPYTVDSTKRKDRWVWIYLKKVFKIQGHITGLHSPQDAYSRMISWNEKVPFFGYSYGESDVGTIQWLGKKLEDGARPTDFIFFSRPKPSGHVMILGKYKTADEKEVFIKISWVSGEYVGIIANIYKAYRYAKEDRDKLPNHIYLPPRWLVIVIEMMFSVATIVAIGSGLVAIYGNSMKALSPETKSIEKIYFVPEKFRLGVNPKNRCEGDSEE